MTTKVKEPSNGHTSEELQLLIEEDKQERMRKCRGEIENMLNKYKCQLFALPQINLEGHVVADVQIRILP